MRVMKEMIYRAFHLDGDALAPVAGLDAGNAPVPETDDEFDAIAEYDRDFLVRFDYHTNAIEGSALTVRDTAEVIEGELLTDGADKRLRDIFAAKGIVEGWELARDLLEAGAPVSESLIKSIHQAMALDCQPRARGAYRVSPVYIRCSDTVPPSADWVRELMADLVFAYDCSPMTCVARAAAFHAMFECIHPFVDGNGRVGRIVLNYMLEQGGFPPIVISSGNRAEYMRALEDWQVRDEPHALLGLVKGYVEQEQFGRKQAVEDTRRAVKLRQLDLAEE